MSSDKLKACERDHTGQKLLAMVSCTYACPFTTNHMLTGRRRFRTRNMRGRREHERACSNGFEYDEIGRIFVPPTPLTIHGADPERMAECSRGGVIAYPASAFLSPSSLT